MNFSVERLSSIDEAVFDECFNACKDKAKENFPWDGGAGLSTTPTDAEARTWFLNHLETYAATNTPTGGLVFQLKNADTGRVLALHSGKENPNIPGALSIFVWLLNNDESGSRGWLSDFLSSTALRDFVTSINCTKWHADLFTSPLFNAISSDFSNDGDVTGDRTRTRIYSSYGWD